MHLRLVINEMQCTEINTDDAGHDSSTSAGAATRGSSASDISGILTSVMIQPWCFKVPRNGGLPVTFPVRRIRCASKPAGTVIGAPSEPSEAGWNRKN